MGPRVVSCLVKHEKNSSPTRIRPRRPRTETLPQLQKETARTPGKNKLITEDRTHIPPVPQLTVQNHPDSHRQPPYPRPVRLLPRAGAPTEIPAPGKSLPVPQFALKLRPAEDSYLRLSRSERTTAGKIYPKTSPTNSPQTTACSQRTPNPSPGLPS